jgi:hypothetical protein
VVADTIKDMVDMESIRQLAVIERKRSL